MEAAPQTFHRTPQQQDAFAQLLRQRRQQLGLSCAAVAARGGVSAFVVRQYERGTDRVPRRHTLQGLAVALELALPELLTQAIGHDSSLAARGEWPGAPH